VRRERGAVLIVVLWALVALVTMALQLGRSMRVEGLATATYDEQARAYYLALAGLNRALYHVWVAESLGRNLLTLHASVDTEPQPRDVWIRADGTWYGELYGDGSYRVRVTDEGAKLNLNRIDEVTLKQVFVNVGFAQELADALTDAIADWRDPDNLERLNGAEEGYYLSLPHPYPPKDGFFDAIEELLLVRGVTRDLFLGEGGPRLRDIFTVHGTQDAKVNLLTATPAALQAVLGISLDLAQELVQRRSELGTAELLALLPAGAGALAAPRLPEVLTVESEGSVAGSPVVRRVSAVLRKGPGASPTFLQWRDWESQT